MQPNDITYTLATGGDYVPYFYQSGLHALYPSLARQSGPRDRPLTPTFGLSPAEAAVWQGLREPQTVEQIIARGYFAVPYADPTTALIGDRKHTSWLGLDDMIRQIHGRLEIYRQNMDELDQSVCEADNAVFRQEADQGCPADARQRYSANKLIQTIYEQKRAERVNLWRDVSRVRTELPEAAQQYLSSYRKLSILSDIQGESP